MTETMRATVVSNEKGTVVSGLCKKVIEAYKLSNPKKFEQKFGHLDLSVIEDELQLFTDLKDMEKFIAFKKTPVEPVATVVEAPVEPTVAPTPEVEKEISA